MNELIISNTSLGEILKCKMLLAYSSSRTGTLIIFSRKFISKFKKNSIGKFITSALVVSPTS